ncbi:MAG: ATP-dependent Clp protease adapter ClpS, partial [Pseudonocardiales bacterium]|nr:ATP-dependent Clp protease adapter ClpS [Pseudonocardiales bacterium]
MTTPVELEQTQVDPAVDETGTEDRPWLTIV